MSFYNMYVALSADYLDSCLRAHASASQARLKCGLCERFEKEAFAMREKILLYRMIASRSGVREIAPRRSGAKRARFARHTKMGQVSPEEGMRATRSAAMPSWLQNTYPSAN